LAAVAAWNQTLADELAPREITANVIAPGFIDGTEFFRGRLADARREALIEATLLKRVGRVDDIAGVVLFLASPAARYITAQTIHVNGGAWTTR
jgi:3-oxoacyl-[acyl-carrier protein] reductase